MAEIVGVLVPDEMDVEQLVTSFRVAVEPHGYPDSILESAMDL